MNGQLFFFRGDRLFFNIDAFQDVLGVRRSCAVNAAIAFIEDQDRNKRFDHVVPLGMTVPQYLDFSAFMDVCIRLESTGEVFNDENLKEVINALELRFNMPSKEIGCF